MAGRIAPVILAGGSGTRLWPLSTDDAPKQFQVIVGDTSTFVQALDRVGDAAQFLPPMVLTAGRFSDVMETEWRRQGGVRGLTVLEPMRRDSAAAIATAALLAARDDPAQIVLVLAADHHIADAASFVDAVRRGRVAAEAGDIVTFGVKPTAPATSFGYIRPGAGLAGSDGVFRAEAFYEKPDLATATRHLREGYLWNSGNFLFRADVMIAAFEAHAPDIIGPVRAAIAAGSLQEQALALDEASFAKARATSVDYAVMEKIANIAVVAAGFSWSDIGSWEAVADLATPDADGNVIIGQGLVRNARNCLIHSRQRLTVASGVDDLAIIANDSAVLVIPKSKSQEVKTIAAEAANRLAAAQPAALAVSFPKPVADLAPGSFDCEVTPLVSPNGFREHEARWWFGRAGSIKTPEINLMGVTAIGLGMGTLLRRRGKPLRVVTGHDDRSNSSTVKQALIVGLMASGCEVFDIGLAVTPMASLAQFKLDVEAVAMVTASRDEIGWIGIDMSCEPAVAFGPGEMAELRDIVRAGDFEAGSASRYHFVSGFARPLASMS